MSDTKGTISCPECGAKLRIPFDKYIIFPCPQCGVKFEFINGTNYEPPIVDSTPIPSKPKVKRKFPKYVFSFFFFL